MKVMIFNPQLFFNKHIVKISSHLFLIEAATKAYGNNVPAGTADVQCGGFFTDEATIQSPGYPGQYSTYLSCFWTFENECATGFTVTPISFDLEYQRKCNFDKLTFNIVGQKESKVFCGANDGSSTNDDDSSSEYYSSDYDNEWTENADIETGGMDLPFTLEGKQSQSLQRNGAFLSLKIAIPTMALGTRSTR